MIRVLPLELDNYCTKLDKNSDKIDTESAELNSLLNSLPSGAWNDPQTKAFLNNLKTFYENTKIIQQQMKDNSTFVRGCSKGYSDAAEKALSTMV